MLSVDGNLSFWRAAPRHAWLIWKRFRKTGETFGARTYIDQKFTNFFGALKTMHEQALAKNEYFSSYIIFQIFLRNFFEKTYKFSTELRSTFCLQVGFLTVAILPRNGASNSSFMKFHFHMSGRIFNFHATMTLTSGWPLTYEILKIEFEKGILFDNFPLTGSQFSNSTTIFRQMLDSFPLNTYFLVHLLVA